MHDHCSERMSSSETRAASGLALVFAFRMLGMFMVLPVLATYGMDLAGATPALIGLAIGAYGLTQAFFQIPFGIISDRIGRRPVIYLGLILFALGSVLAAQSNTIWGVIAGRVLQGAGAISAAVIALLSDFTREQHRTKAMAIIGITIGLSFSAAMVIGPLLTRVSGLRGLFLTAGGMALLGIMIVAFIVPRSTSTLAHRESSLVRRALLPILKHPALLCLDLGICVLHAILMCSFVALPLALIEKAGLPKEQHWWVYLTALLISLFVMIPFINYSEKKRKIKRVFLSAIVTLMLIELFFWRFGDSLWTLVIGTIVFFTAFNLLEALLPSLVSKVSPAGSKGTAIGVYATSQFLGSALGGVMGGWISQHGGLSVVFLGSAGLAAFWLAFAVIMHEPPYVISIRLPLSPEAICEAGLVERLETVAGIVDAFVVAEEAAIYIKLDTELLDRATLEQLVNQSPVVRLA
ncbi:MFS transporter [Candidatus Pseudomonas adelgestsugas]|uniref:Inner membrane transport protein YajR n=1 Tax=Candidatus Pseudomonas adelgestsugas TaxID=1302376 RepID=A0ABX5R7N9_9PSED|nr:MFS transporter [Candidatus Pseudomonas adelgestsugas]QAX81662.1 Inner membrane transport protein YajR [Candidatus Pseudomonas adelgestsugas]